MNRIAIDKANKILTEHISQVRTVTEWAQMMGYAPQVFTRIYRNYYRKKPIEEITEIRMGKLVELLRSGKEYYNYELAYLVGLRDEKDLCSFINYHRGCSPTIFKMNLKNSKNGVVRGLPELS